MDMTADTSAPSGVATESLAPTGAPETTAAPPAPPSPPTEPDAPSPDKGKPEAPALDDVLKNIYRRANPERDPAGKFAPRDPAGKDAAPDAPPAAEQPPVAPAAPDIPPMPTSWAKANEALWKELAPAARDLVLKREADSAAGVEQLKAQFEPLKSLESVIEPHKADLARLGLSPAEGVKRLVDFHAKMSRDPYRGLLEVAQVYGVDINRYFSPQGDRPGENVVIDRLEQRIRQFEERDAAREQATQRSMIDDLSAQIDAFRKEPNREHFDVLKGDIAALLSAGATSLADAYDKAVWANPTTRAAMLSKQQQDAADKARADAAKKAAANNVKETAAAKSASPQSLDDQLRQIYRKGRG